MIYKNLIVAPVFGLFFEFLRYLMWMPEMGVFEVNLGLNPENGFLLTIWSVVPFAIFPMVIIPFTALCCGAIIYLNIAEMMVRQTERMLVFRRDFEGVKLDNNTNNHLDSLTYPMLRKPKDWI